MQKLLILDLKNRMERAKIDAENQKLRESKSDKQLYDWQKEAKATEKVSSEYLFEIRGFYEFLIEHPDITNDEVVELLNSEKKFGFLANLVDVLPDVLDELRFYGPLPIIFRYVKYKCNEQKNHCLNVQS